jgi:signal transduction histidine kinase
LLLALALAACDGAGAESFQTTVARDVERAADRAPRRIEVGPREDDRWLPEAALPRYHLFPRAEIAALEGYAAGCGSPPASVHPSLRKALTWARYHCGQGTLPPHFFSEPPFMHPDGRSFAWHACASAAPECAEARVAGNFHVLERAEVDPETWPRLDRAALVRMEAGEPFAGAGATIFVRRAGGYAPVEVAALLAADTRLRLGAPTGDPVATGAGSACDSRAYGRCWVDVDARRASSVARRAGYLVGATLVAGLLLLAFFRARIRRAVARERVFAMRWLAHELRTPITALRLEIEGLRDSFEGLPEGAQDGFLRIARDVTRLQRIVEASAVYLRSDAVRREPPRPVPSLRAFVEAVAAEATEATCASVVIDAPDAPASLPVGSAALVLRNLVRNAVQHGMPPYQVRAEIDARALRFEVVDAGELADGAIRSLGDAFTSAGSDGRAYDGAGAPTLGHDGLGLGLYLACHAVASLGGRLEVSRHPTRFSFRVPRGA